MQKPDVGRASNPFLRPASISCVHCQQMVVKPNDLCPPPNAGLTGAFAGLCGHCGLMNYAIFGPPDNVREAYRKLALDKLDRYKSQRPDSIACDTCQAPLAQVSELPTEGLQGVRSAHVAECLPCRKRTFSLVGDPEAIQGMRAVLQSTGLMDVR